jgi:hypothetical protein
MNVDRELHVPEVKVSLRRIDVPLRIRKDEPARGVGNPNDGCVWRGTRRVDESNLSSIARPAGIVCLIETYGPIERLGGPMWRYSRVFVRPLCRPGCAVRTPTSNLDMQGREDSRSQTVLETLSVSLPNDLTPLHIHRRCIRQRALNPATCLARRSCPLGPAVEHVAGR